MEIPPSHAGLAVTLGILAAMAGGCGSKGADHPAVAIDADAGASYAEEEVTVDNAYGTLHGTLLVPPGAGPFPAALVLPGSGPTDRNGNDTLGVAADSYRKLAQGLADRKIATLRYDKGGVAASAAAAPAREDDLRFEMGAADAALWVGVLRKDPRVRSVTLAGHSEGSLLAMLVAKGTRVEALVSIAGAGRPVGEVLRDQLAAQLSGSVLATANDIVTSLEAGQLVANVPNELMAIFRPSVQPYMISWMKYDPAKEIMGVPGPVLIAQGTTDVQVSVDDAKKLAAARPDAQLAIIDGMNHVLKASALDQASQNATYTSAAPPIVPGLLEAIGPFVLAR